MLTTSTPCPTCVYKDKMTVEEPCYHCIDNADIALWVMDPTRPVDFASYVPIEPPKENDNDRIY